jgi:hypothetical protein
MAANFYLHLNSNIMIKIIIFVLLSIQLNAQMYISSDWHYFTKYNEDTKEYDLIEEINKFNYFELSKGLKTIKHTCSDFDTNYIIKTVDEKEKGLWVFKVVSDIGNDYTFIVDINNQNIRLMMKQNEEVYMLQYTIKKSWTDEE